MSECPLREPKNHKNSTFSYLPLKFSKNNFCSLHNLRVATFSDPIIFMEQNTFKGGRGCFMILSLGNWSFFFKHQASYCKSSLVFGNFLFNSTISCASSYFWRKSCMFISFGRSNTLETPTFQRNQLRTKLLVCKSQVIHWMLGLAGPVQPRVWVWVCNLVAYCWTVDSCVHVGPFSSMSQIRIIWDKCFICRLLVISLK